MSMTTNIHGVEKATAHSVGRHTHWVQFDNFKKNLCVAIFCPNEEVAQATADAFNDAIAHSQAGGRHEPA